jgi:uncharacterized FAD-dependent dehydrogenase
VGVAPGFDPAPVVEDIGGLGLLAELVFAETEPRVGDRLAFLFAGEVEFRNPLDEFEAL